MTAVMEPPTAQLAPATPDTVTDLVELYTERRERLVRFGAKLGGGRDQGEDAVQEAITALLSGPRQVLEGGVAPAAFLTNTVKYQALAESKRRGRQVPAGDTIDWQLDAAPPADDLDTLAACMGDPATVDAVDAALAQLPGRQATAIRLRMLTTPPVKVAEIARQLGVTSRRVYEYLTAGMAALAEMRVELPEEGPEPAPVAARSNSFSTVEELTATLNLEHPGEWLGPVPAHETLRRVHGSCSAKRAALAQQAHNAPLTPPMRIRAGSGPDSRAAADAELVATLDREFPGQRVTIAEAEQTLRRIHTTCSLGRARQARTQHNAKLPAPEGVSTDTPSTKSSSEPTGAEIKKASPTVGTAVIAAPATCTVVTPVVAEVWLMGAKPPISCLLVNTDETTGTRDLAAVSMPGAQREITGQLIGEGYRPDGPWVDIDPSGPEAMRKFQRKAEQR